MECGRTVFKPTDRIHGYSLLDSSFSVSVQIVRVCCDAMAECVQTFVIADVGIIWNQIDVVVIFVDRPDTVLVSVSI